ncbi:Cysteine proteinase [Rhizoctonia solani]|uniref:Cysteine proteinase n=1 Tax=Rhizoctonia solani TaxID=456999 RepID=A0A8H7I6W4_9AGAM|nr:Cysteine proteinase [Rhizoctonia solani]
MAKGNTLRKERKARVPVNASRPRTRGQRGKLHDPAANTAELTTQLRSMGLYAAPTLGDGNCLFRALSDQIYGTPNEHLTLRKEICAFMAAHKERFEAFVDDDRSWDQHISTMRNNGTYGGHLELTAFAQLKVVNVKVVQPGLVYVIEGAKTDIFDPGASSAAADEAGITSSKERRKGKKERLKKKKAEKAANEDHDEDEEEDGGAPFPATVYVAARYILSSFSPPSQAATKRSAKQQLQSQSMKSAPLSKQSQQSRPPTPSDSLSPPPSRSPKRAIDEDDEEEEETEIRKRNRRGTITVTPPEDDGEHEEDEESEFAAGVSSSVSAESGSFISDAPPPPPPSEPELEPKLTKGKRKSLGVPKARSSTQQRGRQSVGMTGTAKSRASTGGTSEAPKRETRSATKAYRDAGKVRDLGTGEWLDNGTGRLDVRGFRELRI